jgi:hypothetical protein
MVAVLPPVPLDPAGAGIGSTDEAIARLGIEADHRHA